MKPLRRLLNGQRFILQMVMYQHAWMHRLKNFLFENIVLLHILINYKNMLIFTTSYLERKVYNMFSRCQLINIRKEKLVDELVKLISVIICSICYFMIQLGILPNTDEMANFTRFNMIHNGRMNYELGNLIWDISSEISYLIFGYSYNAVRLNNTLLYAIIIFLSLNIISYYRKNMSFFRKWSFLPFYIYMVAVLADGKSIYYGILGDGIYMYPLNNHCTAIIFTLIFINFTLYADNNNTNSWKKHLIQICILLYGCIWTDSIFVLICVLPSIIYYGVLLCNRKKDIKKIYTITLVFLIMLILINILAYFIPQLSLLHREKVNQYRDGVYGISNFGKIENLGIRIATYLCGIMGLFNCLFFGNSILNINNFTYAVRFFILILCIIIIFSLINKWVKLKYKNILVILALGELALSFAFLMADFGEMYINQRYLGSLLYFSIIIVICEMPKVKSINDFINKQNKWLFIVFVLLIFLRVDSIFSTPDLKYEKQLEQLAEIINTNKLGSGFSQYWISYNISSKLNEGNAVDPVDYSGGCFCKSINTTLPDQVDEYNYIIIANSGEQFLYADEIQENLLKDMYGNFIKYKTEDFSLYYFDNAIDLYSGYIDSNVGIMRLSENTIVSNDKYILKKSGYIYGPYVDLAKGVYQLEIYGNNLNDALINLTCDNGATDIEIEYFEKENEHVVLKFGIKENMDNVEFVIKNSGNNNIIINSISYFRNKEDVEKYLALKTYNIEKMSSYIYKSTVEKDYIIISSGGYIYGPYAKIEKGDYTVNIYGENLDLATFEVQYNCGENKIKYSMSESENGKVCIFFKTDKDIDNLEIVTRNMSEKEINFYKMEIIKQ